MGRFKFALWRWIRQITSGMRVGIITRVIMSDHIMRHNACGDFPNNPSPPPLGSHVSGNKAYRGLSAFFRDQWHGKNNTEKLSLFHSDRHVSSASHRCIHPAALASCREKHSVPATLHVTFDRSIIRPVPSVCTAGICFITFWIYKDENELNMSTKTALLRTMNGFLSSQSALGWNSSR